MTKTRKEELEKIPGIKGLPFFGNTIQYYNNPISFLNHLKEKHGIPFKFDLLGQESVALIGDDIQKRFLVEDLGKTVNYEAYKAAIGRLFPNGLLLMDHDQHKYHRSIISSAFKKEALNGYLQLMIPIIDEEIRALQKNQTVLAYHEIKELTLKLAGKAFLGIEFSNDFKNVHHAIDALLRAAVSLPVNLWFNTFGKGIRARKFLVDYFKDIIAEKRKNLSQDLFSTLCNAKNDDGERLNDQEIIDHLIFFLMAAHDTTTSSISSWIYELGKNPEWQDKIRAEVSNADIKTFKELKDLRKFSLLSDSIKESLRMHPPVATMPRRTQCPVEFNGKTIPEDTQLTLSIYHSHHSETIWTDPLKYDPDRFNKERSEHQKCPHAYSPFGAGKHFCLGYAFAEMQMQLIMIPLLQQYKWRFPDDYICDFNVILLNSPKDGLPTRFQRV